MGDTRRTLLWLIRQLFRGIAVASRTRISRHSCDFLQPPRIFIQIIFIASYLSYFSCSLYVTLGIPILILLLIHVHVVLLSPKFCVMGPTSHSGDVHYDSGAEGISNMLMMIIWWSELSWSSSGWLSRYVIIKMMYIGTPCKQIWGLKRVYLFAKLETNIPSAPES